MEQIQNLNFDKCFLGSLGLSEENGASTSSSSLSSLNKEVMRRSKKSFLLVDSTKIGKTSRYKFAEVDDFDVILCIGDAYSDFEKRENVTNIEPNN